MHELFRRLHTNVAAYQRLLQLVPELLGNVVVLQSLVDSAKDLAGPSKTEFERVTEEASPRGRIGLQLAILGNETGILTGILTGVLNWALKCGRGFTYQAARRRLIG